MKKNGGKDVKALHSGAIRALKAAVANAITEHKSAGVPVAVWRNGKVVQLSASRLKSR